MGMPARVKRRWTTREVRALINEERPWPRYELIAGELVVTPAPSWTHQVAVFAMARILHDFCERGRLGVTLMSPADLELVPGTITQPDVFVIPYSELPATAAPMTWKDAGSLLLAVEVLSPSSLRTDRVDKREFYLGADVPDYWVVDLDARMVEQWRRNRDTPIVARETLAWKPVDALDELSIDLPAYFEKVSATLRRPV